MKNGYSSFVFLFLFLLSSAGCVVSDGTDPNSIPVGTGLQHNLEAIALSEDDAPYNVTIVESRYKQKNEVSDLALNLGWQGGYRVRMAATFDADAEPAILSQDIAIYPEDHMPEIVNYVLITEKGNSSYTVVDLPDPGYGVFRGAYAAYSVNTTGFPPAQSDEAEYYEVIFTRGPVFEVIRLSGPSADYSKLLVFTKTAFNKF